MFPCQPVFWSLAAVGSDAPPLCLSADVSCLYCIEIYIEPDIDLCWQTFFLHHIFNVSGMLKGQTSLWSCCSSHPLIINTKHTDLSCCLSITTKLTHSLISPDIIQKSSHIFFVEEYQRLIIDLSRSSDFISSWWSFELLATKTERCVMQRRLWRDCFAFDRPLTLSSATMRTSPQSRLEGHVERCKFRQDHRESCKA